MIEISLDLSKNTPQYCVNKCTNCTSIEGKSLNPTKNRGCCFYFPKFSLLELQRMSKTLEGIHLIKNLVSSKDFIIYKYYIHCVGTFDSDGYSKYIDTPYKDPADDIIKDKTIFFRTCPFVTAGSGCSLPPYYRTTVCNFYICNTIYKEAEKNNDFTLYIRERQRYSRWVQWENDTLQKFLEDKNLDLKKNFQQVIDFLIEEPLDEYEFPILPRIYLEDTSNPFDNFPNAI